MPLSSIKGTGSNGQIVKADIEHYLGTVSNFIKWSLMLLFDICSFFHVRRCIFTILSSHSLYTPPFFSLSLASLFPNSWMTSYDS